MANTPTDRKGAMTTTLYRRKQVPPPSLPHRATAVLDGKDIERDALIAVDNEPGLWKFRYVYEPDGAIVVFGGLPGREHVRSFRPDRCHPAKTRKPRKQMTEEQREAAAIRMAHARRFLERKEG